MYYPQEILDQILANTDIVDVVSAHVHLQKRGKSYVGLCPFHNERTPSFHVNPDGQFFHCFGCGAGGNAMTFLMKYNNSTFREAVQELAGRAGIALPAPNLGEEQKKREARRQALYAINKEAATYYYRLLRDRRGQRGLRYFQERALAPATMQQFGLGFADGARSDLTAYLRRRGYPDDLILASDVASFNEKQGLHDRFWNRVIFPIQDLRGRVIGFGGRVLGEGKPKYLNSSDSEIFDKGRNLYALNLARRSRKDYLILCEGYMDVIAMHQAGFAEAVASLGTAFTPGQAALLKRYVKKVLLAYDSDDAGVRAALRNIGILRAGGLDSAVIDLRPYKDPDECIKAEGAEAFQARIEGAENSFFYELRMLSRNYRMDDPASRTAFHREIAKKLCTFSDEIERENYMAASAEKYFIKADSLRRLVAQYGRAGGFGAPEGAGRGGGPPGRPFGPEPGYGQASRVPARQPARGGPAPTRAERALWRNQRLLLTWLSDEPGIFPQVKKYLGPEDFGGDLFVRAARLVWASMESMETSMEMSMETSGEGPMGEPGGKPKERPMGESGEEPGQGASSLASRVIARFEAEEDQEAVASMFSLHLQDPGGDPAGRDRAKSLREILLSIKEASLDRMMKGDGGTPGGTLQDLLSAKQALQALRSARFAL